MKDEAERQKGRRGTKTESTGRWQMANGKGVGRWQMADGKWEGSWQMADGTDE
jgi:hypothetical protein